MTGSGIHNIKRGLFMKIIKIIPVCLALLIGLSPASFSMDASSAHIAVLEDGTSFSAPLVTIDAFNAVQEILHETGQAPLYSNVKAILLKK
jgi:hypothetical protein